MEQHLFEGQTCLQIIITIYCNTGARGWSPVTEEINGCRLFVCLFGYCIYIILGNVKLSKSKEINISPVLTHNTTHELIVADERVSLQCPLVDRPLMIPVRYSTHKCNFSTSSSSFFFFFGVVFPTTVSGHSGYLSSQAGTDKTGVILPPSSSSSKNDK